MILVVLRLGGSKKVSMASYVGTTVEHCISVPEIAGSCLASALAPVKARLNEVRLFLNDDHAFGKHCQIFLPLD